MSDDHKALRWVELHFPSAIGNHKAALILAYGAGLDAGLAEAQAAVEELAGVTLMPIITDPAAFDARTDELRAKGWTKEADARDRSVHRKPITER